MGRFEVQAQVSDTILEWWNEDVFDLTEFLPKITEDVGGIIYEGTVLEGFKFTQIHCETCERG
jgi:hypothetical protein